MSHITVIGSVSNDPELKYTDGGTPVATFSVGENTAKRGEQAQWTNYSCVAFGDLAENVAASLNQGDRVIVAGRMKSEEFTRQDGTKGRALKLYADEVAPSLRWASVEVERNERKNRG